MPNPPSWRPIPSIVGLFGGRSDPDSQLFLKKTIPYGSPGQSASPKMILYWSSPYEVLIEKMRKPLNFLSQINFFTTIFGQPVFHLKPPEASFIMIWCFVNLKLVVGFWKFVGLHMIMPHISCLATINHQLISFLCFIKYIIWAPEPWGGRYWH